MKYYHWWQSGGGLREHHTQSAVNVTMAGEGAVNLLGNRQSFIYTRMSWAVDRRQSVHTATGTFMSSHWKHMLAQGWSLTTNVTCARRSNKQLHMNYCTRWQWLCVVVVYQHRPVLGLTVAHTLVSLACVRQHSPLKTTSLTHFSTLM